MHRTLPLLKQALRKEGAREVKAAAHGITHYSLVLPVCTCERKMSASNEYFGDTRSPALAGIFAFLIVVYEGART